MIDAEFARSKAKVTTVKTLSLPIRNLHLRIKNS